MKNEQKLHAAISIIQSHILAIDSALVAEKLFPKAGWMQAPALEVAVKLLREIDADQ